MDARVLKNRTSRSQKIKPLEVRKSNLWKSENRTLIILTIIRLIITRLSIVTSIYQREDEIDGQDGLMDDKTNVH